MTIHRNNCGPLDRRVEQSTVATTDRAIMKTTRMVESGGMRDSSRGAARMVPMSLARVSFAAEQPAPPEEVAPKAPPEENPAPNGYGKWTAGDIAALRQMVREGIGTRLIAKRLGRSRNSINQLMLRIDLTAERAALAGHKKPSRPADAFLALSVRKRFTAAELLRLPPLVSEERGLTRNYVNTAFLISLMRAGHKPGCCEFNVSSDGLTNTRVAQ
jgi:hypothetical protein